MNEARRRHSGRPHLWQAVEQFMADRGIEGVSHMVHDSKEASHPNPKVCPSHIHFWINVDENLDDSFFIRLHSTYHLS